MRFSPAFKLSLCILVLSLFLSYQAMAQTWRVAIVLPLTGPLSPIGENLKRGYQLALEEAQKKGLPLEALWIDEKDLKKSPSTLDQALENPATIAVIGAYSSRATFALAGRAEKAHIPLIIPSSMAHRLTRQGYQWVFRICPSSKQYLEEFVFFMVSLFPSPPSTALVYEDTPWGTRLQKRLARFLARRGVTSPLTVPYTPGGTDYPQVINALTRHSPSLIILVSSTSDTLTLYRNIRSRLPSPTVSSVGMGLSSPHIPPRDLVSLEGLFFPSPWIPQVAWPGAQEFSREYSKIYGDPPDYHAAEAYSALTLLANVLTRTSCPEATYGCRKKVRRTLERGPFSSPLGPVLFVSEEGYTHQNRLSPLIVQIQHGKPVVVYPPQASTGTALQQEQKPR